MIFSFPIECTHAAITKSGNTNIVDEIADRFGSNIVVQMRKIVSMNFPSDHKDLYLEMNVVCKWLGYEEGFHPSHLLSVLSWQDTSGCLKEDADA